MEIKHLGATAPSKKDKPYRYHPSKVLFIPFFLFFIGISIIAGRFLYAMHHPAVSQTNNTPGSTAATNHATTPFPTPQIQNGMQVYTNSSDQFSFTYPATLQMKQTTYGLGVTSISLSDPNATNNPQFQLLIFPALLGNYIGQDFDTYYAMQNGATSIVQAPQQTQKEQVTKIKNTTVNGLKAVEITAADYPTVPNQTPNIGEYIEIGSNVVVILTAPQNQTSLNTILASFQYPTQ